MGSRMQGIAGCAADYFWGSGINGQYKKRMEALEAIKTLEDSVEDSMGDLRSVNRLNLLFTRYLSNALDITGAACIIGYVATSRDGLMGEGLGLVFGAEFLRNIVRTYEKDLITRIDCYIKSALTIAKAQISLYEPNYVSVMTADAKVDSILNR